ncbi:MAG: type I-C CRISPR-associated protein Cas8c/Csd1 [Chloroflexota bacterium]
MILQALTRYYDILQKDPDTEIAPPGYSTTGVSFALNISAGGELRDVFPLFEQVQRGKKTVETPRRMQVPEQVKRAGVNPLPNFLCDNSAFVLGLSEKDAIDKNYAPKRFQVFREFNKELLQRADCGEARAVMVFLDRHDPAQARQHPVILAQLEGLLKGGNLVFMFQGAFVHEHPAIRQAWENYKAGKDAVMGQCLVTGETAAVARLHPSLKRVRGAQSTGASLVSFNDRAYESYNRTKGQGLNAPVSERAAFAYTTALNYLLSSDNPNPSILLGDTTVVYWAESEKKEYPALFAGIFGAGYAETADPEQQGRKEAEEHLGKIATKVQRAQALDVSKLMQGLDENVRFYVLGLAPNAARVSVRFFITEPFGKIIERIMQHYKDLEIVKEFDNQTSYIPLRSILAETVSQKGQNPEPAPLLAGAVMRAILSGGPYPAALFTAILNRVRADMDDPQKRIYKINYVRAAVTKAFLLRKYRRLSQNPFKEVLVMSLNEQSTIPAYVLGRLFAVLEKVQQEAIGSVGAGIKDRYFTSACATPASVFPVLLRLSQHHIAKAEFGYASDRRIQQLLDLLEVESNPFPAHLTLDEQGVFILGYYQQRAAFYVKSDKQAVETIPTDEA